MEHNLETVLYQFEQYRYTCIWSPKKFTNLFSKLCIYPVIILWNNTIPSSHYLPFSWKWVTRKLLRIKKFVDLLMLHIFVVLNVIITHGRLGFFLVFDVLLFVLWSKYKTRVMIISNNSIPSSHSVPFSWIWGTSKLLRITKFVDLLCCTFLLSWMW